MSKVPLYLLARVVEQAGFMVSGFGFLATLEATQEQIDVFFSPVQYRCHQNPVASVGD